MGSIDQVLDVTLNLKFFFEPHLPLKQHRLSHYPTHSMVFYLWDKLNK